MCPRFINLFHYCRCVIINFFLFLFSCFFLYKETEEKIELLEKKEKKTWKKNGEKIDKKKKKKKKKEKKKITA